jgi:hypothetical protein
VSMQVVHLRPNSPLRPPDWRWLKVKAYRRANRELSRFKNDRYVFEAHRFNERLEESTEAWQAEELCDENESLFFAYSFYSTEGRESNRWELEARLLSKEDYASIATKLGCTVETVDLYEKLFFNVSDRLDSVGWVINSVIGRSIHTGLNERDYDLLWKMYGYLGGPYMLDLVIKRLGINKQRPSSEQEASLFMADALPIQATMNASKAMVVNPVNNFTAVPVMQVEQTYRQIQKDVASGNSVDIVMNGLNKVFQSLFWSTGSGTIKHQTLPSMKEVDVQAVELRASEMIQVAAGQIVNTELDGVRLPEPEKAADE